MDEPDLVSSPNNTTALTLRAHRNVLGNGAQGGGAETEMEGVDADEGTRGGAGVSAGCGG